jgi:predicted alpha/beta superfamily hydrolase
MRRPCIAFLLLGSLILGVASQAQTQSSHAQNQAKRKPKSTAGDVPGTTTFTSFDEDHTVIGWLEVFPFESKIFHNTRMLRVLVPGNYFSPHNASRRYPVLYMQDGQNLFDVQTSSHGEWHTDETMDHLVGGFKIPPMFVVGIDNAGEKRSPEYLPYPDPHNGHDNVSKPEDVHGSEYTRFVVTEVMPFIEKHYRVARGAVNTGIGGSSYGGDIALYTALKYPRVFGHVLVESPPLWVGDGQLMKDAERAKRLPEKMYLGTGNHETDDAEPNVSIVKQVEELEAILRKKGMGATRLKVVVEEGGKHNEEAWSRRLPDALLFLYGR